MKYFVALVFTCFWFVNAKAQNDYFQQEVNYKIDVLLDDSLHYLKGNLQLEYINNSPNQLDFLYLHLWPNAYRDQTTAFARQQSTLASTKFHFASAEDLGYIHQLDFTVNDQPINWELDKENSDIAKLYLNKSLKSGDTIIIKTPFEVKIPASFSRLGHIGQSYQITQWYPKPAVYDQAGWHPMPYLDMGEFYSEFGSYDVRITLPANYVVGATGVVQEAWEKKFLEKKIEETNHFLVQLDSSKVYDSSEEPYPPSSTNLKTITFKAEKVHDFAWFADKRFKVQKSEVNLASGKTIDTWVMFTDFEAHIWKDAIGYMNRAVRFMSENVGEYPYPQATAVQAALSAGGGMEYPMITVIDAVGDAWTLDELILHEVGHNWFYGILASNERAHPWMDEGLVSFYEQRYNTIYYGAQNYDVLPSFLIDESEIDILELAYLYQARRNQDQTPENHSRDFSRLNYLLSSYLKPARALHHLEAYLGRNQFDTLMQGYFQKWQFRHPQPHDFRTHLESQSGKDLSWLFDGYLFSAGKLDYKLIAADFATEGKLRIRNKGAITAPFPVSGLKEGEIIHTQWYEGFEGEKEVAFQKGDYDEVVLDKKRVTLDIYRKNNYNRSARLPFRLKLVPTIENEKRNTLFWLPAVMWNNYDKLLAGLLLYNTTIPAKRFQFYAAPLFGFNSKDLTGMAHLEYNFFPLRVRKTHFTLGLNLRSANFNYNNTEDFFQQYVKVEPFLKFELPAKHSKNFFHYLKWRSLIINTEVASFDLEGFQGKTWEGNVIQEFSYNAESRRKLHPFQFRAILEQQSYRNVFDERQQYWKATIEWQPKLTYARGRNVHFRVFAGGFIANTKRKGGSIFPGALNMIGQGFYDYRFDGVFLGRNEGTGFWSQQIAIMDGGFKNTIGQGFALGRSNNFLLAINTSFDLPFDFPLNLPLKPYFDIGYFDNAMPTGASDRFSDQIMWSGGFMLEWLDGLLSIYFPLANSKNIQDRYAERGGFGTRISFSIDINKANPYYYIDRISF